MEDASMISDDAHGLIADESRTERPARQGENILSGYPAGVHADALAEIELRRVTAYMCIGLIDGWVKLVCSCMFTTAMEKAVQRIIIDPMIVGIYFYPRWTLNPI
jgi:hypothetical protein